MQPQRYKQRLSPRCVVGLLWATAVGYQFMHAFCSINRGADTGFTISSSSTLTVLSCHHNPTQASNAAAAAKPSRCTLLRMTECSSRRQQQRQAAWTCRSSRT